MKKIILFLLILFSLTSCEFFYNTENKGDVYFVSSANNYTNIPHKNSSTGVIPNLKGSISDQEFIKDAFSKLAEHFKINFEYHNLTMEYDTTNSDVNTQTKKLTYNNNGIKSILKDDKMCNTSDPQEPGISFNIKGKLNSILDELATKVDVNDTLIFYYTGHGHIDNGNLALDLFFDTVEEYKIEDLKNKLDGINCRKFVILDSCHSGYMAEGENISSENPLQAIISLFDSTAKSNNMWVLGSSQGDKTSYEKYYSCNHHHGIMTHNILKSINYDCSVKEITDYNNVSFYSLYNKVSNLFTSIIQKPVFNKTNKDLLLFY